MSNQRTLPDLGSATSLQGSESGVTPYEKQDGEAIEQFGPDLAHVNLSARQADERGLLTSGTSGPLSTGSFKSVVLTLSLVSRLQAKQERLGSTLYRMTWKTKGTPVGRLLPRLVVSALPTNEGDCIGWPTPLVNDALESTHCYGKRLPNGNRVIFWKLPGAARLTASGVLQNGLLAETVSVGRLNPAHSRWLMGLPTAWDDCAATATR